jgi:VanZ family protein
MRRLIIAAVCFIVYGSLFPFSGWDYPTVSLFSFLSSWPASIERADIGQNILAYITLGLYISLRAAANRSPKRMIWLAASVGFLLSFTMESIQQFLPSRVASLSDLCLNIFGTGLGAFVGLQLSLAVKEKAKLHNLRVKWLRNEQLTSVGLICIIVWVLAQTSPWVPTFDVSQLRRGASAFSHALHHPSSIVVAQVASYFFTFIALGLVWSTIVLNRKHAVRIYALFFSLVLLSKVIIAGRQLSLEATAGFGGALLLLPLSFSIASKKVVSWSGGVCVAFALLLSELTPGQGVETGTFNWVPLIGQLHSLNGFQSLLELFWFGYVLAYFSRINTGREQRMGMAILGAILLTAAVFTLEWLQQDIPGRSADITPVILCLGGWIGGWFGLSKRTTFGSSIPQPQPRSAHHQNQSITRTNKQEQ